MPWPQRLVMVRHAESEGNVRYAEERANYEVASFAYNLTERGKKQAEITGQYLKEVFGQNYFDTYYSSYYARSLQTMQIMFPNVKPYEDPRLAEAQRGIWHTMTKEKIAKHFPEEIVRKTREGLYHYRPLGGENWPDIELRIHSFLGTLSRDYGDQNVLMVVHGHWLILFQRLVERFSIAEALTRYQDGSVENASVTIFTSQLVNDRQRLVLTKENVVPWKDVL